MEALDPVSAAQGRSVPTVGRWLSALFVGVVIASAAASVGLATVHPLAALMLPVVALSTLALALGVRAADAGIVSLLVLTVATFQQDQNVLIDAAYLALYLCVLGTWYGGRIVRGEPLVRSVLDAMALTLTVGGVVGGIGLGVLHGAPWRALPGEAIGFSAVALFLPVRELVRTHRWGPVIGCAVLVWFGVWVALRNLLAAYLTITSATQLWQIQDVRVADGDILVHFGAVMCVGVAAGIRSGRTQLLLAACGVVCLAGVFLSKSRGYWVDLGLAVMLLMLISDAGYRARLIGGVVGVVSAMLAVAFTLVGPATTLMLSGAVRRLVSISDSFRSDVSLVNRFAETDAVMSRVASNPIVGHGFGTEYSYHSLVGEGWAQTTFIHNGFAGVWFKLGLWGLVLTIGLWAGAGASGIWASRYAPGLSRFDRAAAAAAGVAVWSLLPTISTSNPFTIFATLAVLGVAMGVAHGISQRSQAGAGG